MFGTNIESIGSIAFWGFSPALDFRDVLRQQCVNVFNEPDKKDQPADDEKLNILQVGAADCRHFLKTCASLVQGEEQKLNFFVIEPTIEGYARLLLQLYIAFESSERIGLQDKVELFLELYGNTLIRTVSQEYLRVAAKHLIRAVTDDPEWFSNLHTDITLLKFKEKDLLEYIFKFWADPKLSTFDIGKCWDHRLRKHLGSRYDAIPNVFDWDCSITLHDRQATQIKSREYSHWRRRGVAFELRQADYCCSNRSLASGKVYTTMTGDKMGYWGYWGDITCSPYLNFGLDTSKCEVLGKSVNGAKMYGATQVSLVTIKQLFWQISHGTPCPQTVALSMHTQPGDSEITGGSTSNNVEQEQKQTSSTCEPDGVHPGFREIAEVVSSPVPELDIPLHHSLSSKIRLLPVNSFLDLPTRYRSHFVDEVDHRIHILYVGVSVAHQLSDARFLSANSTSYQQPVNQSKLSSGDDKNDLDPLFLTDESEAGQKNSFTADFNLGLSAILQQHCLIIVESVLYVVELRPIQIENYVEHIKQTLAKLGFRPYKPIDPLKDTHLFFCRDKIQKPPSTVQ